MQPKKSYKHQLLQLFSVPQKKYLNFNYCHSFQFMKNENSQLTNRELEIVRLIEKEYKNRQIAKTLFISERTVETHRKNIFRKTNSNSVIGLVKYAYEQKLI
jgi:DNA-binding NarL/FixJ family response regulator